MKGITHSTLAKVTAIFLIAVFSVLLLVSAAAIVVLTEENVFFDDGMQLRYDIYKYTVGEAQYDVMYGYLMPMLRGESSRVRKEYYTERYASENSNIFFTVEDDDGNLIYENYSEPFVRFEWRFPQEPMQVSPEVYRDGAYFYASSAQAAISVYRVAPTLYPSAELRIESAEQSTLNSVLSQNRMEIADSPIREYYVDVEASKAVTEEAVPDESQELFLTKNVTFTGYIRENLTAKDQLYYMLGVADFFVNQRYVVVAMCILLLLLTIILFIFLMCGAGHRKEAEGITLNPLDKVPLDLYGAFALTVISMLIFAVFMITQTTVINVILACVAMVAGLVSIELMALSLLLTFATRVKYGKWWRNTLVFKILFLVFRILRWFFRKLGLLITNISLLWKAALIFMLLSFFEMIVIFSTSRGTILLWWFIEKLITGSVLFFLIIDLSKIRKGGEEIARGNTEYRIDTKGMFGSFKRHAVYLNSISDGMQKALDDRMKSERLKTELITNVSHDLKTPLTSIVNYVDLMKKENIQPEKAREYLDVLDRQSKRLQKLTVDLLEASKASTGNMPVNAEKTDINVFWSQLTGEYGEKLAQNDLELVISAPQENVFIFADGRLMWRVFDNLMNNICKYAQPKTRVYVSAEVVGQKVVMTFKNVSRYALNISSDELMERFVRGDQSRNTEGSGLGLSIARSLVDLQKGKFELVVDGDLFKAIVTFDRYEAQEK